MTQAMAYDLDTPAKTGGHAYGKKKELQFLRKNRAEVIHMSIFEYDEEEEKRKFRKAEREGAKEEKAKEIALEMMKHGMSEEQIADILKEEERTIKKWLNKTEVVHMSIFEYDEEEEKRKLREAEYEGGYNDGIKEGELRKSKEVAVKLAGCGMSEKQIAKILKTEENTVLQWIKNKEN